MVLSVLEVTSRKVFATRHKCDDIEQNIVQPKWDRRPADARTFDEEQAGDCHMSTSDEQGQGGLRIADAGSNDATTWKGSQIALPLRG